MRDFVNTVVACKPNMIYVKLSPETLNKIDIFTKAVIKAKSMEGHHIIDNGQEYKRFYTGMMGECAVEQLLGVPFVDWDIGNSNEFNHADLTKLGLKVGIKTVEMHKFPIIHKKSYKPEIICIKRTDDTVIICGLATTSVLNTYQDDDLILSPKLRARGTKTGFYGFDKLIPIHSYEDLMEHACKLNLLI
jgi:hypothetical protein